MPKLPQEGPNPLFTRWLEEWRDQAEENGRLKSQRAYERALSSLRKYPLPLRSGREARILMYFGEKICRQLDEQLERHRSTQDDTAPDKMLLSCTKQELEDERPLQPRAGTCRLLTFAEFNEGAVKNKAQTVYEVFARQLMQVSGLSGEKAAAILEKYKTPASLMEAYAACPDGESQEYLLSTIKCGQLQSGFCPTSRFLPPSLKVNPCSC
uniref:Crossover junction endonuclease MUS81 n=1 Tax=Pseudonaja textilis TaxID=8673 RepID=A0A670Z4E9_PSETE